MLLKQKKIFQFFAKLCFKEEEKFEIQNKKIYYKLKCADNFLILVSKKYQQISNYLNMKYNYNLINKVSKNRKIYKKKISLYCVDSFNPKFHKFWIKKALKNKFRIKFDKNNPDYLIYNIFGDEHLNKKYKNAIKIAIFTENKIPDLSDVDYAIGHAHINYLDRYFKFPIFLWCNIKAIKKFREKILNNPKRTKFCAAVISHGGEDKFRTIFINELNKYKKIDMGGRFLNNVDGAVKDKILHINFLLQWKTVKEMDMFLKKYLIPLFQEQYPFILEIILLMNI